MFHSLPHGEKDTVLTQQIKAELNKLCADASPAGAPMIWEPRAFTPAPAPKRKPRQAGGVRSKSRQSTRRRTRGAPWPGTGDYKCVSADAGEGKLTSR